MTIPSAEKCRRLIVAIDGPSGAGKSSVTKALAERLGYVHIDTGAMFRVVALLALRSGVDPDDHAALASLCSGLDMEFVATAGGLLVKANGEDVTSLIRSPEISLLTSKVAAVPEVRSSLLSIQRKMGERGGVVLEGRDIGTVVFPDADVKIFLTASPQERGRRRYLELAGKGVDVTLERTVAEVVMRDEQDMSREYAPLRRADDAFELDSTTLTPDEVVAVMENLVRSKENSRP